MYGMEKKRACTPYPFYRSRRSSSDDSSNSNSASSRSGSSRSISSSSIISDSGPKTRILIQKRRYTREQYDADRSAMLQFWQEHGASIERKRQSDATHPYNRNDDDELLNTRGVPEPGMDVRYTACGPMFRCPDCVHMDLADELAEHHLVAHPKQMKLFACLDCTQRFARQEILDAHRMAYHPEKAFCYRCRFLCSGEVFIREHALLHESRVIPRFMPLSGITLEPKPRRRIRILERVDRLD